MYFSTKNKIKKMKLSRLLLGIKSPEKTLDYYIRQLAWNEVVRD